MEKKLIYLETGSTDPCWNLAFEEYVLLNKKENDVLILWQNDNAVIIGQNQNTAAEINAPFVEEHGVRVVRRTTGGGAVYHDLGNLNYSFISDYESIEASSLERFTRPIVAALAALGVRAEASGRNDILVEGCKVSGTARRIAGGRILYHGTLLFDSNPEMVAGTLKVDPEKIRSKGVQSVRSRVGNIRSFLREDMTLQEFWEHLKKEMAGECVTDQLSGVELAAVSELADSKYRTREWNYGGSAGLELHSKKRFPGGGLEVSLETEKGTIRGIQLRGDYLSMRPSEDLTRALEGCPYDPVSVSERLRAFDLREYLGGITEEQFIETIF